MKPVEFPHKDFEKSPAWKIVEKAIGELAENGDFLEQTDRRYIVGYLIKQLSEAGMLATQDAGK